MFGEGEEGELGRRRKDGIVEEWETLGSRSDSEEVCDRIEIG